MRASDPDRSSRPDGTPSYYKNERHRHLDAPSCLPITFPVAAIRATEFPCRTPRHVMRRTLDRGPGGVKS